MGKNLFIAEISEFRRSHKINKETRVNFSIHLIDLQRVFKIATQDFVKSIPANLRVPGHFHYVDWKLIELQFHICATNETETTHQPHVRHGLLRMKLTENGTTIFIRLTDASKILHRERKFY